MAKCLPEELWEKALEYCSNAFNHERITGSERICRILEKEAEPNTCSHVYHYTEGMRAPVFAVYFEEQSKWRERDVYAACKECDRELQEWGKRIVTCDDCGHEHLLSQCIVWEVVFADPMPEEDRVVLVCKPCFEADRNQSRIKREMLHDYSPNPWANKAQNN